MGKSLVYIQSSARCDAFVPFINILNLATYSANSRFENLLSVADMLVDGEVVPPDRKSPAN
jgi:hypothetical protein